MGASSRLETLMSSHAPPEIARAFRLAVAAAADFRGATAPNPTVGCALLDAAGGVLAVAAHEKAGTPHAEAAAIAKAQAAGLAAHIHTVVVTLEPCNHTGRTPPCVDAILGTPAQVVWIGALDPNPVAGGGALRLKARGLAVQLLADVDAELAAVADDLIAPFAKRMRHGLPFVTVKQAIDRSGSMIPPTGQTTFTSESSLLLAHELRKRADAILTGSGTILADNPSFTVRRVADFDHKRRALMIADRRGRVDADYLRDADARGFDVALVSDVEAALRDAAARGVLEVLVEAGPQVTKAVLDSGVWDEHVVIAQDAAGGPDRVTIRRNEKDSHVFRHH